ncbi:unnamed protein product [Jaminaea pallidilutea]
MSTPDPKWCGSPPSPERAPDRGPQDDTQDPARDSLFWLSDETVTDSKQDRIRHFQVWSDALQALLAAEQRWALFATCSRLGLSPAEALTAGVAKIESLLTQQLLNLLALRGEQLRELQRSAVTEPMIAASDHNDDGKLHPDNRGADKTIAPTEVLNRTNLGSRRSEGEAASRLSKRRRS